MKTLLFNHTSPETAYVCDSYPYGSGLRCKMRWWLDYSKNKGFRLMRQSTNPRRDNETFSNKPSASTYSKFGGAMYLDDQGHVQWSGLHEYKDYTESKAWFDEYGAAVPEVGQLPMKAWLAAKLAHECRRELIKAQEQGKTKGELLEMVAIWANDLKICRKTEEDFQDWIEKKFVAV